MATAQQNAAFAATYIGGEQTVTDAVYDFVERNWTRHSVLGPVLRPRIEVAALTLPPQSLGLRPLDRALEVIAQIKGQQPPHPGDPL